MKNKTGRILLEQRYGKGCFMERAGIRKITPEEEKELKRKIKGFKKLRRGITYHHIKQRKDGGEVSIENGANIAEYNHEWLHQQSPEVRDEINRRLQEFKLKIDLANMRVTNQGINCEDVQSIDLSLSETVVIKAYDNTEEDREKRKQKFNRAKSKKEAKSIIDEELYR